MLKLVENFSIKKLENIGLVYGRIKGVRGKFWILSDATVNVLYENEERVFDRFQVDVYIDSKGNIHIGPYPECMDLYRIATLIYRMTSAGLLKEI